MIEDIPTDERLRAIGFELGLGQSPSIVEDLWRQAKRRPDVIDLHRLEPDRLKRIVTLARGKARGKMDEAAFDKMVRDIAAEVVKEAA